jgi:sporulation protein YlmC with PRC-barrel domain
MPALLIPTKTKVVSASTLAGYRVRSQENEDLGTIEEIMIDPAAGHVTYAILSFGGMLGFGDKLFAVPWQLLRLNSEDRVLIFDWDCGRLNGAPVFDQDADWPDFADETWEQEIRDYYGLGSYRFNES